MKDLNIKKIQPTKGYVLVEPAKAEAKTSSGIILPENESEKPQYGLVLAVGEASCCDDCCDDKEDCCGGGCGDCGCDSDEEKVSGCCEVSCCEEEAPVKVGDKVIYKKWGGNEFKIGDTEYQFLKFEDILAVIK
jgi:chaperonin GroES